MPYINTKTNIEISHEKEVNIKSRLGEAVSALGKREKFLMVNIEDLCRLYFGGDGEEPVAFVEVRLFGKATNSAYDEMTASVTDIISGELGISQARIYVQYEEVPHWGWNGSNF